MRGLYASVLCAALASAAPAMAQTAPTPAGKFLQAADTNDFKTMAALMARTVPTSTGGTITSAEFIRKLSNCYLRRIYPVDKAEAIMAGWMCDEGQGKSRVMIAKVADGGGLAQVTDARELRSDQPAPPARGSAFAVRKS